MDNVGYVSLSAQVALRKNLDVVANNVANMNTTGFKSDRLIFSEFVAKNAGSLESKPVSFVQDKETWTDFSEGPVRQTDNPLNVALVGSGFLAVETPNGISYTRDGRMLVSNDGTLVNTDGDPVLDADAAPIMLPNGANNVSIGKDGMISNNGAAVARLGVFANDGPNGMNKLGNSAFQSAAELEPAERPQVLQGMLEDSNVNGISEMTNLINITRTYNHANSISESADELRKLTISKLGRV